MNFPTTASHPGKTMWMDMCTTLAAFRLTESELHENCFHPNVNISQKYLSSSQVLHESKKGSDEDKYLFYRQLIKSASTVDIKRRYLDNIENK